MRTLLVVAAAVVSFGAACSANDDIPAPNAGAITPDHGAVGTIVLVTGAYFCQRPDNGQDDPTCMSTGDVAFGVTPATPTTWADDAIMVEVPAKAPGEVSVTVEVAGRDSNQLSFTVE